MLLMFTSRMEEEISYIELRSVLRRTSFSRAAPRPTYIQEEIAFLLTLSQEIYLNINEVVWDCPLLLLKARVEVILARLVAHSHAEAGPLMSVSFPIPFSATNVLVSSPAATFSPTTNFSVSSPATAFTTHSPATAFSTQASPATAFPTRASASTSRVRAPAPTIPVPNQAPANAVPIQAPAIIPTWLEFAGILPNPLSDAVQSSDGLRFVPGLTAEPVQFSRAITPVRYADVNGSLSPADHVTGNHSVSSNETMAPARYQTMPNGTSSLGPLQSGLDLAWPDFNANEYGARIDAAQNTIPAQQSTILPGLPDWSLLPRLELRRTNRERRLRNGGHQEPHTNGVPELAPASATMEEPSLMATVEE